jgi:hypothetical protein
MYAKVKLAGNSLFGGFVSRNLISLLFAVAGAVSVYVGHNHNNLLGGVIGGICLGLATVRSLRLI